MEKDNWLRLIVLVPLWIAAIFLAPITAHSQTDIIELPSREVNLIIGTLYQKGFSQWISLIASAGSPKEEATLAIMRRTVKTSTLSFLLVQAPKEIALDFIKIGSKVASVAFDPGLSSLSKLGADELKKIAIEQLVKNEVRTGGGNLSSSYPDISGNFTNATLPYVLAYNPKTGRIEINIYSPQTIKTPQPTLSNPWSGGIDELPPFVINVSGTMKKTSGGYLWENDPKMDINFSETVSAFEFKELSFMEKQFSSLNKTLIALKKAVEIIESGEKAIAHLWDIFKNVITSAANKGVASIYSIIGPSGGDETLVFVQKDDSPSPSNITAGKTSPELTDKNSEEVQRLLKIIADMEKEINKSSEGTKQNKQAAPDKVDINAAFKEDLTRIIHIGPARAEEIIRLRPFSSLDDLIRVSGIGEKAIADIKAQGIAYVSTAYEATKEETDKEIAEKDNEKQENNYCNAPININTASTEQLICLPGVGEAIAQRIIDYRKNSFFNYLDDLLKVSGIGPATLEKIKNQGCAYVSPPASEPPISGEEIEIIGAEAVYSLKVVHPNELAFYPVAIPSTPEKIFISRGESHWNPVEKMILADHIEKPPKDNDHDYDKEIEIIEAESLWTNKLSPVPANPVQRPDFDEIIIRSYESEWKKKLLQITNYG